METITNTPTTNKWQARIEKRRSDGQNGAVSCYVDGIIRDNHVSLDDVESCLTSDELQAVRDMLAERAKRQAEEKAQEEAHRLKRQRWVEENNRLMAAFYEKNPPSPLTAAPDIETESALFDVLARYHIAKVEVVFGARYHWERFEYIENLSIGKAMLPGGIQTDLHELPADDEGCVGDAISEVVEWMADERASQAVCLIDGRVQEEGTVTFDVPSRRIIVDITAEVTSEESFQMSWGADEDTD
jgi:hypothetical protein